MEIDIQQLATELIAARNDRATVPSLAARYPGFSMSQGYAVANAIAQRRIDAGDAVAGRKIGLTNRSQWAQKQTHSPIWGYVHDSTLLFSREGKVSVGLGEARAARLEPEFAFRLSRPIDPADTGYAALLGCIEWAAPCFELIDCHFEGWNFNAAEGIADSGVHYRLVVGEPLMVASMPAAALAAALESCQVTLSLDGEIVERGVGSNSLGHPLKALAAFVEILAADRESQPLAAGEVVTTGTLTTPRDIAPGQTWTMQVSGVAFDPLTLVLPS